MKKETWAEAFDHIDPELITESKPRTAAAHGKERSMKKFSILQIVTGAVATAAVVAIVGGCAVLISNLNQKVDTVTPGDDGSAAETQSIAADYADSTAPAVTTTAAAETTAAATTEDSGSANAKMPVVPAEEQNILGGKGEIVTVTPARRGMFGVGHPVFGDELFLYWNNYRTSIETGATAGLSGEYCSKYQYMFSDETALYYANGPQLFILRGDGSQTPLYTYTESNDVQFVQVMNLATAEDLNPWYFISGRKDIADGTTEQPFALVYLPATGDTLDLTDKIDWSNDAQWDFKFNGTSLVGLNYRTNTLTVFPNPEIMMAPAADWEVREIALPEQKVTRISSWRLENDSVIYVNRYPNKTVLGRFWLQSGTEETREFDTHTIDAVLTPTQLIRLSEPFHEDGAAVDITVMQTAYARLLNGAEETPVTSLTDVRAGGGWLCAAGDGVALFEFTNENGLTKRVLWVAPYGDHESETLLECPDADR